MSEDYIIAGNCLMNNDPDKLVAIDTAYELKSKGLANAFRCKLWGGGTMPDRYMKGIQGNGVQALIDINDQVMPAGTEVQTPEQVAECQGLSFIWIGARNSQNYGLLECLKDFHGVVLLKRGFGMTIKEVIGIYDIMKDVLQKEVHIIERGINTFDRDADSRWNPDLKGMITIKLERPDIFENLMIDCSHSVGKKKYIEDNYKAFKAIGITNFMFECTVDGKSKTDQSQMLSIDELERILK